MNAGAPTRTFWVTAAFSLLLACKQDVDSTATREGAVPRPDCAIAMVAGREITRRDVDALRAFVVPPPPRTAAEVLVVEAALAAWAERGELDGGPIQWISALRIVRAREGEGFRSWLESARRLAPHQEVRCDSA